MAVDLSLSERTRRHQKGEGAGLDPLTGPSAGCGEKNRADRYYIFSLSMIKYKYEGI